VQKPAPLVPRGGCWFEAQGAAIHVGVEDQFQPARKAHPALVVRDLEGCRAFLRAAGAPVVADDSLPDVRRFYTADPFGNRIELIQDGDAFTQRSTIVRGTVRSD
jgi:hypothetical protein